MKRTRSTEEVVSIRFKKHQIYAALIPVAFLLGLAIGYYIYGKTGALASGQLAGVQPTVSSTQEAFDSSQQRVNVPVDSNDPALGSPDAPITVIEFADFQCPYCQRHVLQTLPQILDQYGDQVHYIYKDFPLTGIHPEAVPAALAAECAREQGKFWEYHDLLFSGELELGDESYAAYADQLSLDADTFASCYQEARYNDLVRADYDLAIQLGVNATPTFFVNGIRVIGSQPFSVFAEIIESELAAQNN